jgi:hypothetical protein
MGTHSKAQDIVANSLPKSGGQMHGRDATRSHLVAKLLGEKGLPP